jgi:rod shape-determining protein MreC
VVTRSRPRSTRLLVVALVSISLAVITLDYRGGTDGPLAAAGRAAQEGIAPLQKAVTTVTRPVGDFFSGLAHLPSLQDENDRLNQQVKDLSVQVAAESYLRERLADLQDLLGLQGTLEPPSVAGVVIASGISNFDWSVTIDAGSDQGITAGMPVVTGGPTVDSAELVGRVTEVSPNASVVQLILDRRHAVAGVLSTSGETGLVTGQGDDDLRMELVTPRTEVDVPEPVYTTSYEVNGHPGLYPPGILIGTVDRVTPESNAIQESVAIRPAVDFSTLEFVLVLQTGTEG